MEPLTIYKHNPYIILVILHLKEEWRKNVASVVINDYESYFLILRRLWKDIQENKYSFFRIPKEELAKGWDGTLYTKILNDL